MKIITKYVLKEFIKPVIACCLIFLLLFILSESFRIINLENKSATALYYLPFYLLYQIPAWLLQITPMALLLGFLFSYSNLSNFNEITAIKAGGINLNKIFLPIILFSFFFSIFVLFANEKIIPKTNRLSNYVYKVKVRGDVISEQNIYNNINYMGKNNSKYIAKSFDATTNTLSKINIDNFQDDIFLSAQIYAESATFVGDGKWKFINGVIRTFDVKTQDVITEERFAEKIIDIKEKPDSFKIDEIKSDQMSIKDLKKNIEKLKNNAIPANKELTEMYHKVAFPFANTVVILIGIAFAASSIKNNKVISFAVSLVISFMYWGITSIFISLGANEILPPIISAWITNVLFFLVSFAFMFKLKR
jgi:lipopolysaccharide export system permease protein